MAIDNTENKIGLGLTLPIQKGNRGYFSTSTEEIEQAKYNLSNLLQTKKGERLMQPELGTGLHALLFEPNTEELRIQIETVILDSIELWLPYISIEEIIIDRSSEKIDNYKVGLTITFSLTNDPSILETFTFTITQ